MRKSVVTGIDIGTYHIKVVVAELGDSGAPPRIISAGYAKSRGLRHGYIMSSKDIAKSIDTAITQAQNDSGVKIRSAYISFGGVGLDEVRGNGKTLVSRADTELGEHDVSEVIKNAKHNVREKLVNKKILHSIPLTFYLDGEPVLGNPVGMHGSKLEVEVLFITALEQHLNDLITTVEELGIEVLDTTAAPIAASLVTLNKTQKMAGCVLVNVGAETTSLAIFEDNIPISIKVLPIGSSNITNDIALGLKVPLIEAEQIKLGAVTGTDYPKKKLSDLITGRLKDIFKLIDAHLKSLGKAGLLPAGIILTGGGSGAVDIDTLAKSSLRLPSEVAALRFGAQTLKDSSWAVAYGLCILSANNTNSPSLLGVRGASIGSAFDWIKKFLP